MELKLMQQQNLREHCIIEVNIQLIYFCFQSFSVPAFNLQKENEIFLSLHKSFLSSAKTGYHKILSKTASAEKNQTKPNTAFSLEHLIIIFLNKSAVTHTFIQDWILALFFSISYLQLQFLAAISFQQTSLVYPGFMFDIRKFLSSRTMQNCGVISS